MTSSIATTSSINGSPEIFVAERHQAVADALLQRLGLDSGRHRTLGLTALQIEPNVTLKVGTAAEGLRPTPIYPAGGPGSHQPVLQSPRDAFRDGAPQGKWQRLADAADEAPRPLCLLTPGEHARQHLVEHINACDVGHHAVQGKYDQIGVGVGGHQTAHGAVRRDV